MNSRTTRRSDESKRFLGKIKKLLSLKGPIFQEIFQLETGVLILLVLEFRYLLKKSLFEPVFVGDTANLMNGLHSLNQCLKNHQYWACPNVPHFALFQYLYGEILQILKLTESQIVHVFSLSSLMSFYGLMILSWVYFQKKKKSSVCAWLSLLAFSTGPFFWYTRHTFNELNAAFVTLAFVIACLWRAQAIWIVGLGCLATISKEVAFPFLILLGLSALLPEVLETPKKIVRQGLAVLGGIGLGMAMNIGFNYFRFGGPRSSNLMDPALIVRSFSQKLISFAALWASPNGGILFFWPIFLVICFGALIAAGKSWGRQKKNFKTVLPISVVFLSLCGLFYGFANWYAPMGWVAWGPRLVLPWLPALFVFVLSFYSDTIEKGIRWICQRRGVFLPVILALVLLGVSHWIGIYSSRPTDVLFTSKNQDCPEVYYIDREPDLYYSCINRLMWPKRSFALLAGMKAATERHDLHRGIFYFLLILGLSFKIRKESLDLRSSRSSKNRGARSA
jgi:hypothetical protein